MTERFFRSWEHLGQAESKQQIPRQAVHTVSLTHEWTKEHLVSSLGIDVANLLDARVYDYFGVQRPGRHLSANLLMNY